MVDALIQISSINLNLGGTFRRLDTYDFGQQLGGQVVNGLSQNAQGGQDEDDPQDGAGSEEEEEERKRQSGPNYLQRAAR